VRRFNTIDLILLLLLVGASQQQLRGQTAGKNAESRFFDFTAGLGIDIHSAPSIANYINLVAQPAVDQKADQFSTAVEFYAVPELQVSSEWSVALEYSLLVKSYSINDRSGFSQTNMSYQVHMPSLLMHYLVFGEGYRLKFGGGLGYHFVAFDQSFLANGSAETLRTAGLGFKLDAVGNTKFDETFYGSIGFDLRWDYLGTLKRSGETSPVARSITDLPRMSFFNAGVKFGVTFQLF
jgi:hypothetical protein